MRTLIVLCAGGQRIDGKPLYLCRHPEGKIIAERVLEGIYPEFYDRIVYSILEEEDIEYHASSVLRKLTVDGCKIDVVKLPKMSKGPAESVLRTIEQAGVEGEFAVRDSLGDIKLSSVPSGNFIVGLNMLDYGDSIQRMKSKGFIIANEQNIVLDFVEKRFSSDIISVGLYGFRNTEQFKQSYVRLSDPIYNIQRLSVGHIISHMIGYYEKKFYLYFSERFEDWGDNVAWFALQKKHSTLFIDLDELLKGRDIEQFDEICGKTLGKLSCRGIHCVFYCSDLNKYSYQRLKNICDDNNINIEDVICRKSYSTEKYFINSVEDIEKLMLGI